MLTRPACEPACSQRAHDAPSTSEVARRRSFGVRSVVSPDASCSISSPSAAASSSWVSPRGCAEASAAEILERAQVGVGPAVRDRLQGRAAGGLQQQRVGRDERAAAGLEARLGRVEDRGDRQRDRIGVVGQVAVDELLQARDVAVGGELERRGQQVLLGVEPVGGRRERQPGHLGDAAVRDRVDPDLGDDLQHRLEQRLAPRGTARARGVGVSGGRHRHWYKCTKAWYKRTNSGGASTYYA